MIHKQSMLSSRGISIEPACSNDEQSILQVMKPWNMHHVPSPEMESLDMDTFFVARFKDSIVGAAGYKLLGPGLGKTTLLAVLPSYNSLGIGRELQHARCQAMHEQGVTKVITNSDLPATIRWYQKHYGYQVIGRVDKIVSFGSPDVDYWTTMEMNLNEYMQNYSEMLVDNYQNALSTESSMQKN